MLSRRIFRELTDQCLLGPSYKHTTVSYIAAQCRSCRSCSRSLSTSARFASSSSTRWKSRQGKDFFAREARVQGLKSRAAFKLLEVRDCGFYQCLLADSFSSMRNTSYSSLVKLSLIWYA
jgi:21S rRNA (uridine2791-2'-O)-methyltransferase